MLSRSPRTFCICALVLLSTACHRRSDGSSGGTGSPATPTVAGTAQFRDLNDNGVADAGDALIVTFNGPVRVNDPSPDSLVLSSAKDSFGAGAQIAEGPDANQVTLTLGDGARLRTRDRFDRAKRNVNAASGIDVSDSMAKNAIEDVKTGGDAVVSSFVDVQPELVGGNASGLGPDLAQFVTGDLNADGVTDVVAVTAGDASGSDVVIYEGLESGGFLETGTFEGIRSVALADITHNGRPDLIMSAKDDQFCCLVFVLPNTSAVDGPPTFGDPQAGSASDANDIAPIDVDRDGYVDIALASPFGIEIIMNDGGTIEDFSATVPGGLINSPDLEVGDLNNDGFDDLLVARDGAGANQVLINSFCDGAFLAEPVMGARDTRHLALVDLDGDTLLDLVGGGEDDVLETWLATPEGGYVEIGGLTSPDTGLVAALEVVDLDRDGAADLVWSDGLSLRQAFNDRTGLLVDSGTLLPTDAVDLDAADFDRDGDDDVLAAGLAPAVWSGSLSGTWGDMRFRETTLDVGTGPVFALATADVDGDGTADLAQGANGSIEIRLGDGQGLFFFNETLDLGNARATGLAFGDLDLDGDPDLVASLIGTSQNVWLNEGGTFVAWGDPVQHRETCVALGDLDRDGDLDAAFGQVRLEFDFVVLNDGVECGAPLAGGGGDLFWNGFDDPIELPGNPHTADVAAGDIDADGDLDLVFGHGGSSSDRVFLNDGDAGFTWDGQEFTLTDTRALALGDFDGDGDLDLSVGKPGANELWHNDGSGAFSFAAPQVFNETNVVALGHIDGDALVDLFVGNDSNRGWDVWFGTSDGLFSDGISRKKGLLSVRDVVLVDVNGDATLDMITGAADDLPNVLWLNL